MRHSTHSRDDLIYVRRLRRSFHVSDLRICGNPVSLGWGGTSPRGYGEVTVGREISHMPAMTDSGQHERMGRGSVTWLAVVCWTRVNIVGTCVLWPNCNPHKLAQRHSTQGRAANCPACLQGTRFSPPVAGPHGRDFLEGVTPVLLLLGGCRCHTHDVLCCSLKIYVIFICPVLSDGGNNFVALMSEDWIWIST